MMYDTKVPVGGYEAFLTMCYVDYKDRWVKLTKRRNIGTSNSLRTTAAKLDLAIEVVSREQRREREEKSTRTAIFYIKVSDPS